MSPKKKDGVNESLLDRSNETPPKATFAQLFRYTTLADKLMYVVGCLVSVATGLGMPLMAIVIGDVSQNFMDFEFHRHIGDLNETELHRQFAANVTSSCFNFVSIGTGVFFAATLQSICFLTACESMINRLRRQFFLSIVRQDTTWFDKNQSGTLATKLFDNIERVKEGSGDKIGVIVQNVALFLGGFAVAFSYNWKLTLIMMSLAPFMLICGAAISKLVANAATEETQKYAVAGSIAQEVLTAIRTVIVFNGQEKECSRYDRALNDGKKTGIKKSIYLGVGVAATYLIMFSFYGLAFWVGTNYVAEGVIAGGTVMVVFFSVMMGAMSLGQAGPQLAIVGTALGAAGALYQIIDRVPEIDAYSQDGLKPDNVAGRIEVNDLQFTYPTRQDVPILTGISFDVNPGETVALVGSSGCGKSTIMQLLLRYYSPSAGNVTIDGIPLEDFNLEYLRQSIGVVSQEPSLFNTTIEENIRYGRYDVTESELKSALKQSNAYDFVKNLPDGVRTLVGDRGAQLSGGQKQRIAIARALVRNPKILLLDEATSALDAESEHIVQKALEKASEGRTTIVIAHRLSTIKNADKIIVLKAGEIYETGTHEELLLKKGLYYDLVNSQVFTEFEEKTKIAETSRQFSAMSARSMSTQSGGPQSPMLLQTQLSTIYGNIVSKEKEEKEDELDRLKRECKEEGVVKSNFHSIVKHAKPEWTFLIVALFIASVEGCIFPAFSLFFSQIIQVFAEPDPDKLREQGHFWALMFPMLGVIETVFATSQFFLFGLTAERVTMRLRSKVFRNVLRMDGSFFDKTAHSPGKITTRLATDAPNVRAAIDNRLGSVFGTIVQVICGLSIALYFGWKMAIVVVAIFPLSGIGEYIQIKYMESRITEDAKELENSGKIAMEAIDNIRTVQALTLERRLHHQFCQHLDGPYTTNRRKAVIQSFSFGFAASITFILYAVSFMWGLWLILNNQIMSQDVLRVLFAISFISGSLGSATTYFPEYIKATFAGGLINKMLKQSPTIDGLSDYGDKPTINGSIWFKDVYFTYPERQDVPILQGLDIRVSPGETLALVGPSGCGKSTVISLLEKLYDPIEGQILIDDNDLSNINASHLRAHIALVSQEPILFDSSIRENICYGIKDEISIEEVIEVAKQANIHSFITSLPKGYDTPVGDKGTQLSGGQKQRIAIARALVSNPRILLLDEATSALDTESEKLVQEALEVASAGRTCVVVAHRLSTVVKANRIVVLNNGRVVEQGTHRELLALKGAYYNLTQKQAISSSE